VKPLFPLVVASVLLQSQGEDPLLARTKGRADAPVTVYEMADFQCPACRMFTVTVLPAIDREFVQTGKVRWVFINLPLTGIHPNAVAAAEVAMCAARQGRFWPTHDALYQHQDEWAKLPQPRTTLVKIAQRAGVERATLLACLKIGPERVGRPLAELSGGERVKVSLAKLMCGDSNLLILDEPTNHLEDVAQYAFEQSLSQFPGTIVQGTFSYEWKTDDVGRDGGGRGAVERKSEAVCDIEGPTVLRRKGGIVNVYERR